jgi:hypothetical protein
MWIELTETDLNETTGELASVRGALLPEGRTASQVVTEQLAQAIGIVRGYCPAGVSLADGLTIPSELKLAALSIARVEVFTRIQALNRFLTDARREEKADAMKLLRDWNAGKFRVVATDNAAVAQPVTPAGHISFIIPPNRGQLGDI